MVVGIQSWIEPEVRIALSPYMAEAVRKEIDLIDLEPFSTGCSPSAYQSHLDRVISGNPEARDVACVAAVSNPATVSAILDRAPLHHPDGATANRLVRNATSALAGIQPGAVDALCRRLGDQQGIVRRVVGMALAEGSQPGVVDCVKTALTGGGPMAREAAVLPFRQHLARGLIGEQEGFDLIQGLLQHTDPTARMAGLGALPMYTSRVSKPLAEPLLEDPNPGVAEAAASALRTIETVLRTDLLRGNVEP